MYGFVRACIELHVAIQTLSHRKARIWLPQKFQTYPLKPSSPVSERSAYTPCKTMLLSQLTCRLASFGHKSTPSHKLWTEA